MDTMNEIEQKADMSYKVNPLIKIRTADNPISGSGNRIALYFVTTKYYYYIHVNANANPPKLDLESVTKELDPHHDFIRHLQFTEKTSSSFSREDTDGGKLDSTPEDNRDLNSSGPSQPDTIVDGSQSENSSSDNANKPNSLDRHILSDPSESKCGKPADVLVDTLNSVTGEDGTVIEKQTADDNHQIVEMQMITMKF